ncbi:hypothetical protein GCM10017044_25680 [Kordiimonas sediminis]|uniref:Putative DNA-binding domain-containing protein n=1 Tax=Kordiimonas sediminis TaxID=1735581 RepID=A0A919AX24_9PROT|nr:DNA-binding domain-containing protein [Kordiimonas sediminis]GHF29292.1 hypothetical protein GCM10017044_25680 [Kordiimonas sediminis]
MTSLADIQSAMKDTILSGHAPSALLEEIVSVGSISPKARLQIHQNTYRQSLTDALISIFPVMQAFVGEVFMRGLLGEYIKSVPPKSSCLNEYGDCLGHFIDGYEELAHLQYLADVARLEWAVFSVQNSAETQAFYSEVTAAEEQALPEQIQWHLNFDASVIESKFPVLSLWMVGTGQLPPEAVHIDAGGQIAVVVKQGGEVRLFSLEGEALTAYRDLKSGADNKAGNDEAVDQLKAIGLLRPVPS